MVQCSRGFCARLGREVTGSKTQRIFACVGAQNFPVRAGSVTAFSSEPFPVDHRIPGRVAVGLLDAMCWRKMPSKTKTEAPAERLEGPLSCCTFIEAAIAEILEMCGAKDRPLWPGSVRATPGPQ